MFCQHIVLQHWNSKRSVRAALSHCENWKVHLLLPPLNLLIAVFIMSAFQIQISLMETSNFWSESKYIYGRGFVLYRSQQQTNFNSSLILLNDSASKICLLEEPCNYSYNYAASNELKEEKKNKKSEIMNYFNCISCKIHNWRYGNKYIFFQVFVRTYQNSFKVWTFLLFSRALVYQAKTNSYFNVWIIAQGYGRLTVLGIIKSRVFGSWISSRHSD